VYEPISIHGNSKCSTLVVGFGPHGQIASEFLKSLNFPYAIAIEDDDEAKIKEIEKIAGTTNVFSLSNAKTLKSRKDEFGLILNTLPHGKLFNTYLTLCYQSAIIVHIHAPNFTDTITYNNSLVIKKGIQIEGSFGGTRDSITKMLNYAANNKISIETKEFPFDKLDQAFYEFQKSNSYFSYSINVKDWSKEHGFYKL